MPVNVKVIDRSMPTFDKQFYTDSVLESIQVNSPLSLSIHAESPLNRKLIYSITKGNDFEEFALDFNTGKLSSESSFSWKIRCLSFLDWKKSVAIGRERVHSLGTGRPVHFFTPANSKRLGNSIF